MDSPLLVIPASIAGGVLGLLAFSSRESRKDRSNLRSGAFVFWAGSLAFVISLLLFAKVFGFSSGVFALMVTVLVAAWTGMVQSFLPLRLPLLMRNVTSKELAVLRSRWLGIRFFGFVLKKSFLRHLGGQVYLAQCDNNPARVLCEIQTDEEIHVWSVLFCVPWLAFWSLRGWWASAVLSLSCHALLNVYPILHLRLTRGRLERFERQRAELRRSAVLTLTSSQL